MLIVLPSVDWPLKLKVCIMSKSWKGGGGLKERMKKTSVSTAVPRNQMFSYKTMGTRVEGIMPGDC